MVAQKFEITPFYGHMLAGNVAAYKGDLNIRDGGTYGLMIDVQVQRDMMVELYFSRLDTRADFITYPGGITTQLTDMSVNYFQIGVLNQLKKINKISLYSIATLGAVLFSPSGTIYDTQYSYVDTWRFALTGGGGAKIFFSEKVGLRLEARLLMPISWVSGGFVVGTGGSGVGVSAGSAIFQGNFTAGLTIALGK